MLYRSVIEGALDDASRALTEERLDLAGHIAVIGSSIRLYLEQTVFANGRDAIESPSELFEQCLAIENVQDLQQYPTILENILELRQKAMRQLLSAHYRDECRRNTDNIAAILREEEIALILADSLSRLRTNLPPGRFGPATVQEILDDAAMEKIREYVYVLDTDTEDWSLFARLLPADIRERFDATDNGIEVPEKIETTEDALALMQRLSEYKGIPLKVLADPAHFAEHCKQFPAFGKIIHFFMQQAVRAKNEAAPEHISPQES